MRPLRDQVLVRLDPPSEFTGGGLLIPEKQQAKSTTGTVLAVGSGRMTKTGVAPLEVNPGDRVIVAAGAGTPYYSPRTESIYHCLHERLILAVIEED